jgi:hypothetical protein
MAEASARAANRPAAATDPRDAARPPAPFVFLALPSAGESIGSGTIPIAGSVLGQPRGLGVDRVRVEIRLANRWLGQGNLLLVDGRFAGFVRVEMPRLPSRVQVRVTLSDGSARPVVRSVVLAGSGPVR